MEYRKFPRKLENPVDNLILDVGDVLSPIFKKLNFTPNTLTFISMILGLLAIYFYAKKKYVWSAIMFFISYMFDCFDGYYARKYKMVTKFGDIFDHAKDVIVTVGILWLIYNKYKTAPDLRKYLPFVYIILAVTVLPMYLGCQAIYHDHKTKSNDSMTLNPTKRMCPTKDPKKIPSVMKILRYGGAASTQLYLCFLILFSATF
uniref:CDP-alcohol phosphatidyltransferase n=1 Tax=Mimivirus LCMiAC01 TaxID=2506608 RepID=A0A481YZ54_9VIRU|nr:MAG: CDP-alcohol phosphatidyltransferase [Mimivirus LCMiAC01]